VCVCHGISFLCSSSSSSSICKGDCLPLSQKDGSPSRVCVCVSVREFISFHLSLILCIKSEDP